MARARQEDLPEMTDRKITALHTAAADYADIRDQRQELTTKEVDLKKKVLQIMKKNDLETYSYDGLVITVVPGEEDVKVRLKKPHATGDATD